MALIKANPKLTGEVLRLRCVKVRTSSLPAAETFWEQWEPFPKQRDRSYCNEVPSCPTLTGTGCHLV